MCSSRLATRNIIVLALFSRILVFSIGIISSLVIPDYAFPFEVPRVNLPIIEVFAKWDSFYYLDIVTHGYTLKADLWAFRPLYPAVMWTLGLPLTQFLGTWQAYVVVGLIWNTFAFVTATVYLYRLTEMLLDSDSAYFTVLLLAIFPATVFFTAIYPESTYLLMLTAAFYYLEKGKILTATASAVLGGLARPEGFLLCVPLVFKAVTARGKGKVKLLLGASATASSLPLFMLYSYAITGDPFISFKVESSWSKKPFFNLVFNVLSMKPINESIDRLAIYPIDLVLLVISTISVVAYFLGFAVSRKRLHVGLKPVWSDRRTSYYFWTTLLLVVFLYQGGLGGFPRFVSTLFPILWSTALWAKKSQMRTCFFTALYSTLMTLGTVFFVNWYYFL
jgi:Gpi18-like mannosyltransferase